MATKITEKKIAEKKPAAPAAAKARAKRYTGAVGRRKTAIARVRLASGSGEVKINEKALNDYFTLERLRAEVVAPIAGLKLAEKFDITAHVAGGGIHAQAVAVRHGIARALTALNPALKKPLRVLGYLTRDPRMVERKKYGLKKARRAPQWQKR